MSDQAIVDAARSAAMAQIEAADAPESVTEAPEQGEATATVAAQEGEAASTADAKPKDEKAEKFAKRFAEIAKREKAIVDQQKALKAKEEENGKLSAEAQAAKQRLAQLEAARDAVFNGDADPLLEALGADDDKLAKLVEVLGNRALKAKDLPPELIEVKRKLKAMEMEREAERQAAEAERRRIAEEQEAKQLQQIEATKKNWLERDVTAFVKNNAEQYEVLSFALENESARAQLLERVWNEVDAQFKATPEGFDVQKALAKATEKVEDEIAGVFASEFQRLSKLKKLQPKAPVVPSVAGAERRNAALELLGGQTDHPRPRTLTSSTQAAPTRVQKDTIDPKELRARALELL